MQTSNIEIQTLPAPTTKEANGLRDMALQLRMSAMETEDEDYVGLFLSAAIALEERAALTLGSPHKPH